MGPYMLCVFSHIMLHSGFEWILNTALYHYMLGGYGDLYFLWYSLTSILTDPLHFNTIIVGVGKGAHNLRSCTDYQVEPHENSFYVLEIKEIQEHVKVKSPSICITLAQFNSS